MEILTTPEKINGRLQCNISINASEIKTLNEAINKYIQDNNYDKNESIVKQMMDIQPELHKLRGLLNPS